MVADQEINLAATMIKPRPNVWAQWQPLRLLAVGKSYDPDYYEPITNTQVKDALQKIAYETEQDFQQLIRLVGSFGVEIIRPHIGYSNIEIDLAKCNGGSYSAIPKPPMTPRDNALVLGNQLLITSTSCDAYNSMLYNHIDNDSIVNPWSKIRHSPSGILGPNQQFFAPSVTRVGDRIFVDNQDHPWLCEYFAKNFPKFKIVEVTVGGHNDGVFSPIAPGCLLSVAGYDIYKNTFPNWDVCFLPNQSWALVKDWDKIKHKNDGRWWLQDQDIDNDLIEFVETWLKDWVGYVEETVFDVNCLVIDRHHVIFSNYNQQVWDFCKKHQIQAIESPFRHRFFWDGGLHCVTLDLIRDGECEDYFQ